MRGRDGARSFRVMRGSRSVLGKTNLTDAAWVCPTNAAHRFFKVKVEMP